MHYRRIGSTGLVVSAIGLGSWQYGGDWGKDFSKSEVREIMTAAEDRGINFIDTAAGYGVDHLAEKLIGAALCEKRDSWVVCTKFGRTRSGEKAGGAVCDFSPEAAERQLEDSLRALKTDHVDIWLMHSPSTEDIDNDRLWSLVEKKQREGAVRFFGISLGTNPEETLLHTKMAWERGCSVIMTVYNALDRYAEQNGTFDFCQEKGLGVIGRVPLAQGYLSGKYKPGAVFQPKDVRSNYYSREVTEERIRAALAFVRENVPEGVVPSEWAMAWSVAHPAVSACIAGFKNISQMSEGAAAGFFAFSNHPLSAGIKRFP